MENNKAIIAQVERIEPIPGADNIVVATVLGHTVVVSKETKPGDCGVFFNDGLALSKSFMERNNLLARYDEKGVKIPGSGFFSETGRVRAQKFKGVKSEGFFCPLSYLNAFDDDYFRLGQSFDYWNGEQICTKYETPATKMARAKATTGMPTKVQHFPEHKDTKQWRYYKDNTKGKLFFTEKLHGTSARIGNVRMSQKLPWWKKAFNFVVGEFYKTEKYEIVLGSRRVVLPKDVNGNYVGGFYGGGVPYSYLIKDKGLISLLEKNPGLIVYGEIVGYVGSTPLFKQSAKKLPEIKARYGENIIYNYGFDKGEHGFFVYHMTLNGKPLKWGNIKDLCNEYSLEWVLDYGDQAPYLEGSSMLSEDHPTEGYVVREEIETEDGKLIVNFYKEKSFTFKVLEGLVKDSAETVDIEEIQS